MEDIIGAFLIAEGTISMLKSEDKRFVSQLGRVARIAAGLYLIDHGSIYRTLGSGVGHARKLLKR